MFAKLYNDTNGNHIISYWIPTNEKTIMDSENFVTKTLTSKQFLELKKKEQVIQLGITEDGFDTSEITVEQRQIAKLRSIHRALYGLYFNGENNYTPHMSKYEKKIMIDDFNEEQLIMKTLKQNKYLYIPDDEPIIV